MSSSDLRSKEHRSHPSEAHKAGCPICNPDKTVPQLNAAFAARCPHIIQGFYEREDGSFGMKCEECGVKVPT